MASDLTSGDNAVGVHANRPLLGVLGGMGPRATVDFLEKLMRFTDARVDQEHVRVIVVSDPTIPDRTTALMSSNEQPVAEALRMALTRLLDSGAEAIVIPCNTAHHWHGELQAVSRVPIFHIADIAVDVLRSRVPAGARIAVLATPATVQSGFYARKLREAGFEPVELAEGIIEAQVLTAIKNVKAARIDEARAQLLAVLDQLSGQRIDAILLACTELPVALRQAIEADARLIDVTAVLASACVRWATRSSNNDSTRFFFSSESP